MTKENEQQTINVRACTRCGEVKRLDLFCRSKNRKGERVYLRKCKECARKETAERRKDPIVMEKVRKSNRERQARYRATDPEWVARKNEANRIYAQKKRDSDPEHRERVNEFRRQLWLNDEEYREKSNARVMEWIADNPDKIRARGSRRRALIASADGFFTDEDIASINQAQGFECVYCGVSTKENYHVDHITPLSRGGSNWPDNIQILCASCNCSKRDKTDAEYRSVLMRRAANDNTPTADLFDAA